MKRQPLRIKKIASVKELKLEKTKLINWTFLQNNTLKIIGEINCLCVCTVRYGAYVCTYVPVLHVHSVCQFMGRMSLTWEQNEIVRLTMCSQRVYQPGCVVLCCVMLCYVMLCYFMLFYFMLCCIMLTYVMLCYVMLCYTMLFCARL